MIRVAMFLPSIMLLAACQQPAEPAPETQRIDFEAMPSRLADAQPSPDTSNGVWSVDDDGQAVSFGAPDGEPLLTLACTREVDPRTLTIIRHATALPGQGALFPVMGNGMTSRFFVDATLGEDGWHWQGVVPADDPALDVFTGTRDLEATLPGRGMLEIPGNRIPGEFVEWCRAEDPPATVEPAEVEIPGEDADEG